MENPLGVPIAGIFFSQPPDTGPVNLSGDAVIWTIWL
jgi:hypothetical protein